MWFKFLTNLFFRETMPLFVFFRIRYFEYTNYLSSQLPWGYEDHITIYAKKYVYFSQVFGNYKDLDFINGLNFKRKLLL